MGNKATEEQIAVVRSVVGRDFSDMDIIRALHMANNDAAAAINIIFDTPHIRLTGEPTASTTTTAAARKKSLTPPVAPDRKELVRRTNTDLPVDRYPDNGAVRPSVPATSRASDSDWWLVGSSELSGLSTCKGRRLKAGDRVTFSFPSANTSTSSPSTTRFPGRGRSLAFCSDIVRFSTQEHGEIGRIPNEWARCLLPLVRANKIRIEGSCKSAPDALGIMDTILLSVSVYINSSMFRKYHQTSVKPTRPASEESTVHPLPNLFRLLGLTPFKKDSSGVLSAVLPSEKCRKVSSSGSKIENDHEIISDSDLDNIVGISDSLELEEMVPPETLQCELRPYQKQALHWMVQIEKGRCFEEAATTLHPCWDAYRLADKRGLVVYLNAFLGDATSDFPSTLEIARGGILADAMGLGKTIMTIALLLAYSNQGCSPTSPASQASLEDNERSHMSDQSPNDLKKLTGISGFSKLLRPKATLVGGGSLIVCPMTLLGQWKAEIETHVQPGALTVYVHYGQSRPRDAKFLAQSDVVLTTYGVLASEFSAENNLEDIYSLLWFLKVEPWGNWGLWHKLIQKPYEEGDERGLKLVQSILKPIMLRRTKSSTDRDGRPILVLPPANVEVHYCKMSAAEKDFYEALFRRSKVKFDQFVEQGRVLHNYASILELLLRLRQCCDHPFLVMSRGDTQEYSNLNKLAKRFLKGGKDADSRDSSATPSRAYVKEVVEELRKGEEGECPICLEAFEDAVLTPCAHRLCRECLLASWRSTMSGLCPVCRKSMNRQDLITAPTDNRFQIDIEKNWVESSKVSVLLRELENLRSLGAKSIVFSQWTAFLDLLQIPLSRHNLTFVRLDGTLNQQQREKVINEFSEDKNILVCNLANPYPVLLMSLKAGGVGINLTAASNAFLMRQLETCMLIGVSFSDFNSSGSDYIVFEIDTLM
ncbi:DNA repair protein RAD5A [Cocos nucifera]|uniref:DNA repair protein RAD5A n=1 Tax=Cocos nucifera TaxID=13894 RepID=A0A8K0MWT5_COCNU|nr:DNA repair protein RAD5A [Cocos nucifera]